MGQSRIEITRKIIYQSFGFLIGAISFYFIGLFATALTGIFGVTMLLSDSGGTFFIIFGVLTISCGLIGLKIGRSVAKRKNKKLPNLKLTFLDYFLSVLVILTIIVITSIPFISNNYINDGVDASLSKEEYNTKLLFQENKSIIGKWYGLGQNTFNGEDFVYWEFRKDGTFNSTNNIRNFNGKFEINKSKYPIKIKLTYLYRDLNRDGLGKEFKKKESRIAEFLGKNEFRMADSGDAIEVIEGTQIYSRFIDGEKNYLDIETPINTKYLPSNANKISDKEIKEFWKKTILEYLKQIEKQENSYKKLQMIAGLRYMNYEHIEQVQVDNEEVLLMIYFLSNKFFVNEWNNEDWESQILEKSIHYGLIFRKENVEWKLINTLIGDKDDGEITPNQIEINQNELIYGAKSKINFDIFESQNLAPLVNLEIDKIFTQTKFPLPIYWGRAFDLTQQDSTWTKSEFEANIPKLLDEGVRNKLSKLRFKNINGLGSKTFKLDLEGKIEVDGKTYNTNVNFVFKKFDNNYKLILLNFGI